MSAADDTHAPEQESQPSSSPPEATDAASTDAASPDVASTSTSSDAAAPSGTNDSAPSQVAPTPSSENKTDEVADGDGSESDSDDDVDDPLLESVLEMGFSRIRSIRALYQTNSVSLEAAAEWLVARVDDPSADAPLTEAEEMSTLIRKMAYFNQKLVFVVNTELKMRAGKMAAQCCHACDGVIRQATAQNLPTLSAWRSSGAKKIVVKAKTAADLRELQSKAAEKGLCTYLVADAGLTQIPAGSQTVLAIGPGSADLIDSVTGRLKLM